MWASLISHLTVVLLGVCFCEWGKALLKVVPLSFPSSSWGVTKCLSWAQQGDKLRGP